MRRFDPRWLIVFVANLLLYWLTGVINHYLAPFALHLYVGGLFVVYSALRLDPKHGVIAMILTGLAFDAMEPVPYGTHVLLLGLVHATLLYGRRRFPREGGVFGIVLAQFSNLFLYIALSFLLIGANPVPAEAWLRIFVDLLASQIAILFLAPWFLSLQSRTMAYAKIHPETGRRLML
jgi:rod shape-determining protein MreD